MAGQLKIGGNVIATHAGTEGAGTVTLDSSTLTIGSNTTINGSTINSSTTFPAGHIISFATGNHTRTSDLSINGDQEYHFTDLSCDLVTTSTNNKIVVHIFIPDSYNNATTGAGVHIGVMYNVGTGAFDNSSAVTLGQRKFAGSYQNYIGSNISILSPVVLTLSASVPTVNTLRLYPILKGKGSTGVDLMDNASASGDGGRDEATIIAYEVKQ